MEVKFLTQVATALGTFVEGQIETIENTLAIAWIEAGICEAVTGGGK